MLYIARHGRTEANASGLLLGRADPELDRIGQSQALCIGNAIKSESGARPVYVVASPLRRCHETADAIASVTLSSPPTLDERLLELDYGDFDLNPIADIPAETWQKWRSDTNFRPPNGESLAELYHRTIGCLEELASTDPDHDVVVVTHVSPIKAAVAWALGCGIEISWRCFVAQASISEISVDGSSPSLRSFNRVDHLASVEADAVDKGSDS